MNTTHLSNIQLSPAMIAWMQKHITVHRVLLALSVACFFIAWNRGLALLFGLFSLLCSILIISYGLPHWQLRSIKVHRLQKEKLQVGITGCIHYRVSAPGQRHHLILEDDLPNRDENTVFIPHLNVSTHTQINLNALQRGCFSIGSMTISSSYPFGIFNVSKTIDIEPNDIIIYPRVVELSSFPFPSQGKHISCGQFPINKAGGYEEFMGLREYRIGDPIKHIHWNSSARLNHLMVKEQEHIDAPELLIILNCHPDFIIGEGIDNTLESAIIITASLIAKAIKLGFNTHIAAQSYTEIDLHLPSNAQSLDIGLDALARITPKAIDYPSMVKSTIKQHPMSNLIVTFRLDHESPLEISSLHTHIDIVMNQRGFLKPLSNIKSAREMTQGNRTAFMVYPTTQVESLFNDI